ncbi:phenylacetate--CoA ligase family protein [Azospirillum sp. sgz301742]
MTGEHYDTLETRDPQAREAALMAALPGHVAHAKANAPAYARLLADIGPHSIASRAALASLPVTRKSDLTEMQAGEPPFGGLTGVAVADLARIYCSPGPIFDPEGQGPDHYRTARALYASGVRKGQIVHNCFAYHFTPAGRMFEAGAHAIGCPVFPAGTGNTEQQVQVIAHLKPAAYVGTPDYLKIILEKADELGVALPSLRLGHVTGGAFLPAQRALYAERGIQVFQSYGIADLGLIAYETSAREGLVVAEEVILEIVRPGTGDPVPAGEVGEVVITVPNAAYPLTRFATGDLSAVLPGVSPCGRTNTRIKGWMGRADQTTKVKGMFVHPRQIAEVLTRHPDVLRARLVVDRQGDTDVMVLKIEAVPEEGLESAVADSLAAVTKLKGRVELEPPGSLPNDGKVIDDVRKYD